MEMTKANSVLRLDWI